MDWERIEANWQHFKASAHARWGMITPDEFDIIGGRREHLAGQIQEIYSISLEAAQRQVESWRAEQREPQAGAV